MNLIVLIKARKPRNPFAMASARRGAGGHRPSAGGQRQRAKLALRRELHSSAEGPPDL